MNIDHLKKGLRHPARASKYVGQSLREPMLQLFYPMNKGVYVLDEDWDNLILLDACRFDIFRDVNDIDGTLHCVRSRGTSTSEFIRENFDGRQAYDTIYITGNAMVGSHAEHLDVFKLVGMWAEETDVESTEDNTDPRSLTDPRPTVNKAIKIHEQYPNKRLIVHLLPPHTPFLIKDGERLPADSPYRSFTAVRDGNVPADVMRSIYRENVEYGLRYIGELLDELDGKSVVSSDHGELLGEGVPFYAQLLHDRWSFENRHYYDWAHYAGIREPELVEVPWLEVAAQERRTIRAESKPEGVEMDESEIESQLEALGYK